MGDPDSSTQNRTEKLYGKVCDDVKSRQPWLTRQNTWYVMRHDGIPRRNKPWAHAADMHDPMADTTIEKFKPFYFNQLFGTEVVAQFIPKEPELTGLAGEVGQFFDYKLKQESNLESETLINIDRMLMSGSCPMKVYWDAKNKRLAFDSIEPTHCIVPDQTEGIQEADRITIVHHYTPEQFKRDPQFALKIAEYEEEGDDIVKLIKSSGQTDASGSYQLDQAKQIREGITHATSQSDLIIVWEVWSQEKDGEWLIDWFSPQAAGYPLRATQKNPFKMGKCPIVRFDCEIKDKGWYASRGVPEKMAPYERANCATWNNKLDWMELFLKPIFGSTIPIPNASNIRMVPGQIIPGIQMQNNPARPPSFEEEMQSTRAVAESNIGVPDFGIGGSRRDVTADVTATESKLVATQSQTGVDLRTRVFRLALRDLLKMAWEILCEYDQSYVYFIGDKMKELPTAAARAEAWNLEPNASSESWNKQASLQKAIVRMQLFGPSKGYPQGMPWINQPELSKTVLELDDPRLVQRLFIDPGQASQSEYEKETALIPAMLIGGQFQPKPEEDQAARIKAVMDFIQASDHIGRQIDPAGLMSLQQRVKANLAMLQQKNPQQAQQVMQAIGQHAQQSQPNVIPMQPGGGPPPEQTAAPGSAAPMPQPGGMPA